MKDLITLDHPAIVSGIDPAQPIDGQIEEGNRSRAKRQLEQPTLVKMTSDTPLIVSSRWSASKSVSSIRPLYWGNTVRWPTHGVRVHGTFHSSS
jgi:hypothetical protein